jgi:hypothetical protein
MKSGSMSICTLGPKMTKTITRTLCNASRETDCCHRREEWADEVLIDATKQLKTVRSYDQTYRRNIIDSRACIVC